jgi:hypothetical protein
MFRRGNRENTGSLIDAYHGENNISPAESQAGNGGAKDSPSLDISAFGGIISDLAGRLGVLEERVVDNKVADLEHSVDILQKMLAEERAKNSQLTLQFQDMKQKYKNALRTIQKEKEQNSAKEELAMQRLRTPWKLFNFGQKGT